MRGRHQVEHGVEDTAVLVEQLPLHPLEAFRGVRRWLGLWRSLRVRRIEITQRTAQDLIPCVAQTAVKAPVAVLDDRQGVLPSPGHDRHRREILEQIAAPPPRVIELRGAFP